MKEGLWEITTKAEMKGMPSQMPPTTVRTCISKKDMVPKPDAQSGQDCKMKDQKVVGDTVSYSMVCTGKNGTAMEMSGKMTYKGNVFEGSSTTTIKSKGEGDMQMSSKMTGKYVGPCTK
jgi:hypothetical protein